MLYLDNSPLTKMASKVEYVESSRGGKLILHRQYLYRIRQKRKEKKYYKCDTTGCNASLVVLNDILYGEHGIHHHAPNLQKQKRKEIYRILKNRSRTEISTPVARIYRETVDNFVGSNIKAAYVPKMRTAMSTMYRARSQYLRPLSSTLENTELKEQNVKKQSEVVLGPNLGSLLRPVPPSDLCIEQDPRTFDVYPMDLSVAKPSTRMKPDSSMMEQDIHNALTCEIYPAYAPQLDTLSKIKKEALGRVGTIRKVLTLDLYPDTYKPDIPSSSVVQKHISLSTESSVTSNQGGALFQAPVLIKEEPVYFEEESR